MRSYRIREFTDSDLDEVVALWTATDIMRPWNDPRHDIRFCQGSPSSTLLVLADDTAIRATAMVGEDGHRGWVYYVAVEPAVQGQGIGRRIMDAAENWLKARGIRKVNLLIRSDNVPVRDFYERIGYADTRTCCLQKVLEGDTGTPE